MSNLTKYSSAVTPEVIAQGRKKADGNSKYIRKLPVGLTRLRTVVKPGTPLYVFISQHFIPTPDGKTAVFNCPAQMKNEPCPACAFSTQLEQQGNTELANKCAAQTKMYMNVIQRGREDEGVKIFQAGLGIARDFLEQLEALGNPPFDHPITGRDILITRRGTGRFDTRYTVSMADMTALADTEEQIDAWLEEAEDLTKYQTILPFEQLQAKMKGQSGQSVPAQMPAQHAGHLQAPGVAPAQMPNPQGQQFIPATATEQKF